MKSDQERNPDVTIRVSGRSVDDRYTISVVRRKQQPSWKPNGAGDASMLVHSHPRRKYLEFTIEETSYGKRTHTRCTSISLEPLEARELYEALKAHFDGPELEKET